MSTYKSILTEKLSVKLALNEKPSETLLTRMVDNAIVDSETELQTLKKVKNDAKNMYFEALEADKLNFSELRKYKKTMDEIEKDIEAQKELHKELFATE